MREYDSLGLPKIAIPPEPPMTSEVLERRRMLFEKITHLRDEIGPIDLTVEELLDYSEDDDDDEDRTPSARS